MKFSASILLPIINETQSLDRTIDILESSCGDWVREYVIIHCRRTTPEALAFARRQCDRLAGKARMIEQTKPFLGGALQCGFASARGSHVVMMASDLETDPLDVRTLIEGARARPDAIITCSRWLKGGAFSGYDPVKLLANYLFQALIRLVFRCKLTDPTFGFRIFPCALVQRLAWHELKHPFLLESILLPLRLGIEILEIPSKWAARTEGTSQNTFFANFQYFRTAWRVLQQDLRPVTASLAQAGDLRP